MLFGKTKLEFKVGAFVFIGLVILTVFVLSIGGFKSWTSGYYVKFSFHFVNGVKIGAPIRFAGLDVGQVKRMRFIFSSDDKPRVEILGWVMQDVRIPLDSSVWINTLGLLGEKYVEIMPGQDSQHYLAKGQTLTGTDPVAMHEVSLLAKRVVDNLDATIVKIKEGQGTVGKLVNDDAIYKNLNDLTLDLKKHPWKLFWKGKE